MTPIPSTSSNERYAISAESAACAMNGLDQPEGRSSKTPSAICGLQTAFDLLHDIVGNGHRAQRHAPMTATGQAKYYTVLEPLTDDQIAAHLTGSATYAVPLIGTDGLASAGLIEQDAGGIDMARRILAAAEASGVTMFAIVMKGSGGHDGCHPWALYDGRYDPKAIRAQLQQIAEDAGAATDEIHPNNTNIRLPFAVHLRSKTRGDLLLQSGELYHLDTELEAAERAVMALPLNGQPPAIIAICADKPNPVATYSINKSPARTATGSIDTRAIFSEAIKRFNQDNPDYIRDWLGTADRSGNRLCTCAGHSSGKPNIIVWKDSDGIDRAQSYSSDCTIFPLHKSKSYLDPFAAYVIREHSGNRAAARETIARQYGLWVDPRPKADRQEEPRYTDEQRAAYNAARKEKRHQETRDALDIIYDKACNLEMHDRAHLLFAYLLGLCYERGVLQVAPTNAQISADLDMCERYVQYAFRELEAAGLGKRQGGRNVEGNEAATWTFYRSPNLGCKPHQDAECTLDIYSIDLVLDLRACERAPLSPACENVYADTLDDWEWQADEHGADELSALEYEPTTQPAERMALVTRIEAMDDAQFAAWFASHAPKAAEPEAVNTQEIGNLPDDENLVSDEVYAASYTPVDLLDKPYTGIARQYMTYEQRAALVRESMRLRETPHADVVQLDLPEDEPDVLSPPTDPAQAETYYRLRGAARKARSPGQRIALERKAQAMMVYVPVSEAIRQPIRAGSQAPRAHLVQQAVLYGTA